VHGKVGVSDDSCSADRCKGRSALCGSGGEGRPGHESSQGMTSVNGVAGGAICCLSTLSLIPHPSPWPHHLMTHIHASVYMSHVHPPPPLLTSTYSRAAACVGFLTSACRPCADRPSSCRAWPGLPSSRDTQARSTHMSDSTPACTQHITAHSSMRQGSKGCTAQGGTAQYTAARVRAATACVVLHTIATPPGIALHRRRLPHKHGSFNSLCAAHAGRTCRHTCNRRAYTLSDVC
jgi:hypothetical protein